MTEADLRAWINGATTEELLRKWRFAPNGDEFCTGEVGRYFDAVLKERREADPAGYTAASKAVGWK